MPGRLDPRVDANAVDAHWRRLARGAGAPWLHAEVARRMGERLALVRTQPLTIIDWNAFLGGGSAVLDAAYPRAHRIVVEPHDALHARSCGQQSRAWWSPRRWRGQPVRVAASAQLADGSAELLWANMALHSSRDPPATIAEWHRLLAVDGFLMFSTFGPDTLIELRRLYEALGWPPPAQQFVDMHDVGDWLVHAGFADPVMDQEHLTLTWAGGREPIDELRALGGNLSPFREQGLRTPRWRARLEAALAAQAHEAGGRVAISFEIVYGHAFRAPPRVPLAARTEVPLDAMRAMARRRRPAG